MQNASTIRASMALWLRMKPMPCFMPARIDSDGLLRDEASLQHQQGNDRRKEGEAVQPEAPHLAQLRQRDAAERRTDDARHIELNGLQGDGVRHVFFI